MPRAIPRFELSVKSAEECKVPPFNVRCPAVTEPGADPNPLSALTLRVPALIVVDPAYVLTPPIMSLPAPILVRFAPAPPVIMPETVRSVLDPSTSIVLDAYIVTPRLLSNDVVPVDCNVPPFKIMLSATTEPGTAPKFLSVEMLKVPACIPIEPVFVLVPDKVSVPLPSFTKDPAPLITPDIVLLPVSPV